MRREPNTLALGILPRCVVSLAAVAATGLPRYALPVPRHIVLALISAERNSKIGIAAALNGPLANLMRDRSIIRAVQVLRAFRFVCVWRIEEDSSNTELDRRRRP